jgi:regulator of sigma D
LDTDDDLFLDAVDALARIGDDPTARFQFSKRLIAVAKEVAKERGQ